MRSLVRRLPAQRPQAVWLPQCPGETHSAVQCSAVQCSAVQCRAGRLAGWQAGRLAGWQAGTHEGTDAATHTYLYSCPRFNPSCTLCNPAGSCEIRTVNTSYCPSSTIPLISYTPAPSFPPPYQCARGLPVGAGGSLPSRSLSIHAALHQCSSQTVQLRCASAAPNPHFTTHLPTYLGTCLSAYLPFYTTNLPISGTL